MRHVSAGACKRHMYRQLHRSRNHQYGGASVPAHGGSVHDLLDPRAAADRKDRFSRRHVPDHERRMHRTRDHAGNGCLPALVPAMRADTYGGRMGQRCLGTGQPLRGMDRDRREVHPESGRSGSVERNRIAASDLLRRSAADRDPELRRNAERRRRMLDEASAGRTDGDPNVHTDANIDAATDEHAGWTDAAPDEHAHADGDARWTASDPDSLRYGNERAGAVRRADLPPLVDSIRTRPLAATPRGVAASSRRGVEMAPLSSYFPGFRGAQTEEIVGGAVHRGAESHRRGVHRFARFRSPPLVLRPPRQRSPLRDAPPPRNQPEEGRRQNPRRPGADS